MPLCYNHGLSSGLAEPLSAGGSVICPASFDAESVFASIRDLGATWCTAGASYHQAILE